jgi:hypothetical protein
VSFFVCSQSGRCSVLETRLESLKILACIRECGLIAWAFVANFPLICYSNMLNTSIFYFKYRELMRYLRDYYVFGFCV